MGRYGPDRAEEELAREFHDLSVGERRLLELFKSLDRKVDVIMSEVDDLNAAVEKMTAAVNVAVTDIKTISDELAAASSSGDKAAIEAAAQKLSALADTLSTATPSEG